MTKTAKFYTNDDAIV